MIPGITNTNGDPVCEAQCCSTCKHLYLWFDHFGVDAISCGFNKEFPNKHKEYKQWEVEVWRHKVKAHYVCVKWEKNDD